MACFLWHVPDVEGDPLASHAVQASLLVSQVFLLLLLLLAMLLLVLPFLFLLSLHGVSVDMLSVGTCELDASLGDGKLQNSPS